MPLVLIVAMCMRSGESVDHLFLYCPSTLTLWHRLLGWPDWIGSLPRAFVT